jgi:hypothetical protein
MGKINPRKIVGGLMMMAGGLCGLAGGLILLSKGVVDTAGADSGDERRWSLILPLLGVVVVLMVGGKLLAGPHTPTNRLGG